DEQLLRVLRQAKRPVVLAANKVDDQRGELEAAALWNLGLGEPYPVSALHGRGSGDLLDAVLAVLPWEGRGAAADHGPRRVALGGRPNGGRRSLLTVLPGGRPGGAAGAAATPAAPAAGRTGPGGREGPSAAPAALRRRIWQPTG